MGKPLSGRNTRPATRSSTKCCDGWLEAWWSLRAVWQPSASRQPRRASTSHLGGARHEMAGLHNSTQADETSDKLLWFKVGGSQETLINCASTFILDTSHVTVLWREEGYSLSTREILRARRCISRLESLYLANIFQYRPNTGFVGTRKEARLQIILVRKVLLKDKDYLSGVPLSCEGMFVIDHRLKVAHLFTEHINVGQTCSQTAWRYTWSRLRCPEIPLLWEWANSYLGSPVE